MIESIMYMGIGLLFGGLIGVAFVPLIHGRAVRLTIQQLEATLPRSIEEIEAGKDLLRAEFAMSTRRLEITVEQLKKKIASQLVELGKKSDAINLLKIERETLRCAVAYSSEITKGSLVPIAPTIRQFVQKDTWRRDEYSDVNRLLRILARSRTNDTISRPVRIEAPLGIYPQSREKAQMPRRRA